MGRLGRSKFSLWEPLFEKIHHHPFGLGLGWLKLFGQEVMTETEPTRLVILLIPPVVTILQINGLTQGHPHDQSPT